MPRPDRCRRLGRAAAWLAALTMVSVATSASPVLAGPIEGTPPYPPSPYITEMTLDWDTFTPIGKGSDNWNTTWAADGNLYTSWGDGGGFGELASRRAYVAIGIARLTGDSARTVRGVNLIGGLNPTVAKCFPYIPPLPKEGMRSTPDYVRPCYKIGSRAKSYGLLALGDQLYLFLSPGSSTTNLEEARLHVGPLGGNSWRPATWAFSRHDAYPLLHPVFAQAGRNHADLPPTTSTPTPPGTARTRTSRGLRSASRRRRAGAARSRCCGWPAART